MERFHYPLEKYAGQDIVLSLAVDCGKIAHSCGGTKPVWGDPEIILTGTPTNLRLKNPED